MDGKILNFQNKECRDSGCKGRDYDLEEKHLKKSKFFVHLVMTDPDTKGANIHTHGFPESYNHPDIQIVMALPQQIAGAILHTAHDIIKEGGKLELEKAYDQFLHGYNVQFVWAIENGRDILRMILPDKEGELMEELMNNSVYKNQWANTYPKPQVNRLTE